MKKLLLALVFLGFGALHAGLRENLRRRLVADVRTAAGNRAR